MNQLFSEYGVNWTLCRFLWFKSDSIGVKKWSKEACSCWLSEWMFKAYDLKTS